MGQTSLLLRAILIALDEHADALPAGAKKALYVLLAAIPRSVFCVSVVKFLKGQWCLAAILSHIGPSTDAYRKTASLTWLPAA
jgi:hypothetical protein